MGVPALFRWLSRKYPKIVSPVIEDSPQIIDGTEVPIDACRPNPNGEEFDNLYLDMNGIVHPCSHPEDKPAPADEEEMMIEIFKYTDRVVNMVRPRRLLMIAVDGVAPRAKMNQQRSRRFRSAQEAKEKDEDNKEFVQLLRKQNHNLSDTCSQNDVIKKTWDSNAITPGTPFMDILATSLRYWISFKLNTDPAWAQLMIVISDATVPGEGEHKIMEFIRSQRRSLDYDPNTRHVIYGLDADLIMLGLATHELHFRVLREDVFFKESITRVCLICGQGGHNAENCRGETKQMSGEFNEKTAPPTRKPFIWLHVSTLREYLQAELEVPNQGFPFDLERAIDDWVFMCFFVGNDFLPHLPSLEIRENGIDTLIAIWRDNLPCMGGYLTHNGTVDLKRAQNILSGLGLLEDRIFKRRKESENRREANIKRRADEDERRKRVNSNGVQSSRGDENIKFCDMKGSTLANDRKDGELGEGVNTANKSAARVIRERLNEQGKVESMDRMKDAVWNNVDDEGDKVAKKRKADERDEGTSHLEGEGTGDIAKGGQGIEDGKEDTVRLWEDGYADRYYEQKFGVRAEDFEFRRKVARSYVEGLCWVLLYYFQGCPSWTWYYPYHYAPFAKDFKDIGSMKVEFNKGEPFKPYEQLMGVLPASSAHAIPGVLRDLMTSKDSEILDFYPEEFPIDLNGKKFAWQGVALLPFIDEKRLLKAITKKYPLLTPEELSRNEFGDDALYLSNYHPVYEEIARNIYSKKAVPEFELCYRMKSGVSGTIKKNHDFIPQSQLEFPLSRGKMPTVEVDMSMSVFYRIPQLDSVHKSAVLSGAIAPTPKLDYHDVSLTKSRALTTGRSYGGVPLNPRGPPGLFNYSTAQQGTSRYGQSSRSTYAPTYGSGPSNFLPSNYPGHATSRNPNVRNDDRFPPRNPTNYRSNMPLSMPENHRHNYPGRGAALNATWHHHHHNRQNPNQYSAHYRSQAYSPTEPNGNHLPRTTNRYFAMDRNSSSRGGNSRNNHHNRY